MTQKNKPNINASEIKRWDYCPRQWYLQRTGGRKIKQSNAAQRGVVYHQQQAEPVRKAQKTQSCITKYAAIGGMACLFWLLSHLQW